MLTTLETVKAHLDLIVLVVLDPVLWTNLLTNLMKSPRNRKLDRVVRHLLRLEIAMTLRKVRLKEQCRGRC